MSSVAVDTDLVSFLFKNHLIGKLYDAELAGKNLILSFMTVAQLDRWTLQSHWGEARRIRLAGLSAAALDSRRYNSVDGAVAAVTPAVRII